MSRRVCRVEELPPGQRMIIPDGRFGIGIFNQNGEVFALNNYCPHAGAPVCKGPITGTTTSAGSYSSTWIKDGDILRCPWHGWEYELATGRSVVDPVKRIKSYRVTIEEGWIVVDR